MNDELQVLSETFRRFAEFECRGSSALYERLSLDVASDPEMLRLAANARRGQPIPNLFLAAVHSLLLNGARHELSRFYASVSDDANVHNVHDDPYPVFRDFCLTRQDKIVELLRTKIVQTNVVERCSILLPAFGLVAGNSGTLPLALVEVGTSAGLNLLWDRYAYDYGSGLTAGDRNAPVQIGSTLRGCNTPPIPNTIPEIVSRVGLDLNTIDVNDDEAIAWLRALIWPENSKRVENFYGAIEVVKQAPSVLIKGDALTTLPDTLADAPHDSTLCVYHTHTLNQFTQEARQEFYNLIAEVSIEGDIHVISIEGVSGRGAALELKSFRDGEMVANTHLANCDAHGRWLEWLVDDSDRV